jgi:hypothetical protein
VDPAREGDDRTALCVRQGDIVLELHRWRSTSTVDNARRVEQHVRRLGALHGGVSAVVVDDVALGGGVADELRERMPSIRFSVPKGRFDWHSMSPQVIGYKSSVRAGDARRFASRRAECFHGLSVAFERGVIGFADPCEELPPELLAALREELLTHVVEHRADDRIDVGSKDDIRRALGRSPDLADAVCMAFSTDVHDGSRRAAFR